VFELPKEIASFSAESFSRKPVERRIFLRPQAENKELDTWIASVSEFEQTVSTRAIAFGKIAIWTTNKKGAQLKNVSVARKVLNSWPNGNSYEQSISAVVGDGITETEAKDIVEQFRQALGLWVEEDRPYKRRTPAGLKDARSHALTDLAAIPSR